MSERASLIPPSTVGFERLLPGPVERVWAYLVESDKRATWLAAGNFDLRLGGRIELHFENDKLSDDRRLRIAVAGGWVVHSGILEDQLNGVKPRPFYATHARLMQEHAAVV
jgi:hypothetical protein